MYPPHNLLQFPLLTSVHSDLCSSLPTSNLFGPSVAWPVWLSFYSPWPFFCASSPPTRWRLFIDQPRTIDRLTSQSVYLSTPLGLFTVLRRGYGITVYWSIPGPSIAWPVCISFPIHRVFFLFAPVAFFWSSPPPTRWSITFIDQPRTIDRLTSQSVYLSTPLGLFTVLRRGVGLLSFLWTSIRPSLSFRFLNQVPIFLLWGRKFHPVLRHPTWPNSRCWSSKSHASSATRRPLKSSSIRSLQCWRRTLPFPIGGGLSSENF